MKFSVYKECKYLLDDDLMDLLNTRVRNILGVTVREMRDLFKETQIRTLAEMVIQYGTNT